MNETRPCPYCAEDVRVEAIKCKHCGSFLALRGSPNDWHRSTSDRMVAGVCGGLAQQFGVPTAVTHHVPAGVAVFFQSENALVGMGAPPPEGMDDRHLTDAGGMPITALPGAWSFEG